MKSKVKIPKDEVNRRYKEFLYGKIYVQDVEGIIAKAEGAEEPAIKVHLTLARAEGVNERTSAGVYRTAFEDRLKYKQDKAGPRCLDNTVLQHFNYGFATNSWKELLRRSVQVEADRPEEEALEHGDAGGCQELLAESSDARYLDGREARQAA